MYNLNKILGDDLMTKKLESMICELIEKSDDPEKYKKELYFLTNGYHFDECMYKEAMPDGKWSVDTVDKLMTSLGICFDDSVTSYDKAYVMNMLHKMYYPNLSDPSTIAKCAEKYIKHDYPIKYGRALCEYLHSKSIPLD